MNIQHSLKGSQGIFFIEENGNTIAEMVYKQQENIITITHTKIEEEYEGKGVGQALLKEAVTHSRKNAIKIKATCVFAKKILKQKKEYEDVYLH